MLALATALLWPPGALAQDDAELKQGFDQARLLAGADPARARALLSTLRTAAVAKHRVSWRLALDELDCRLLSDIDPDAGVAVAQAGITSVAASPPADLPGDAQLPLMRLKACHAGLQLDLGNDAAGSAELEAVLASTDEPGLASAHAMAMLERGLHRSRRGDFTHGQQDLLAACTLLRSLALAFDQELCLSHLASHQKRVGDYDEALALLNPLLASARNRQARHDEGIYLYGIGQVHAAREDWPIALKFYGEAMAIETAKNDPIGIAYAEHGIANTLLRLGRAEESLPHIRRALGSLAVQDDKLQRVRTSILHAAALAATAQAPEAAELLRRIEPDVRAYADEVLLSEWLGSQADVQAQLGHWREAYAALNSYRDITAHLQAQKVSQQSARLRLQFNREKDESDIRALQISNEQGQRLRQLQAVALTLFVLLLLATLAYAVHKVREARRLRTLALHDELTGLANRRAVLAHAQALVSKPAGQGGPLSVLMIDVDHFKQVNDSHGHAVGDEVLKALGQLLPASLRALDRLGRVGGEEFLALLPDATPGQAQAIAERMRQSIANAALRTSVGELNITVSIGVATRSGPAETIASLVERADRALYLAKNGGRNTVVSAVVSAAG